MAILCALSLRAVFGLTLRQTQGFLDDLTRLLGLEITVRALFHLLPSRGHAHGAEAARRSGGPVHLAVDATGLKVYGEGEWKVRMHGPDKRRVWRKLHLAVDTRTGALHAHALTESGVHDGAELEGLLAGTDAPIAAVCADKAYDSFECHAAILARDARPVIPPRKGAAIRPPPGRKDVPPTRGAAVDRIAEIGRDAWKAETGYHRRLPRRDRDAALQDADRPEPPLAHLRPPEGRGCRRRALHQPLHRPWHASKHQDRLKQGGKGAAQVAQGCAQAHSPPVATAGRLA